MPYNADSVLYLAGLLTEEEQAYKDAYNEDFFLDWSRRDLQQFIRAQSIQREGKLLQNESR